jgi:hypothetical protein
MNLMSKCRFYPSCNAPICPLDEEMLRRYYVTGGEPICKLDKRSRKRLGRVLQTKGLLPRELGGLKGWKKMGVKSKTKCLKNLVILAPKKSKGLDMRGVIL